MDLSLVHGDSIEAMREMSDASVDSIVTDPPYELTGARPGGRSPATEGKVMKGFMGMAWDGSGIAFSAEMWAEALRVLKPGGHLLAFSGSRTYHRMVCAIEDAGFEIRDQIMWLYGSGFPKSRNLDGDWEGWGTALKPAHEPIVVARKPLVGTVAANVLAHGTRALNIDACRVHADDALGGQYVVKRFAPGASINANGKWKQDADFSGEMKPGRWPANLIHDGSEEVLAAFPDAPGQLADASASASASARKTQNVYGAMRRGRGDEASGDCANAGAAGFQMRPGTRRLDEGSAARFFYCAKTSREDRHEGLPKPGPQFKSGSTLRDAENLGADRKGNHHPTVKPTDLMRYLCRLVTPPDGLVLDPFMGSGSTGKAAVLEGFRFIGIDLSPEYVAIARARIEFARRQGHQPNVLDAGEELAA